MSDRIFPYFEVDGNRYELKLTRHLAAEFNKLVRASDIDKHTASITKGTKTSAELIDMGEKLKEAKDSFDANPADDNLYKIYRRYKEMYDEAFDTLAEQESKDTSFAKGQKIFIDVIEQTIIVGLINQHGLTQSEATKLWETHVDEIGEQQASEWLLLAHNELFAMEEKKDDPFLQEVLNRREKRALQKDNSKKAK